MNDKTQIQGTKLSARRRLISGGIAAPAVLTLYSGGALAASSSKCAVNANAVPVSKGVITGTDTYLRVQLYSVGGVYWVKGSDLPLNRVSTLPTATQGQTYDITTDVLTGSPTTFPGGTTPSGKWVSVRVDATGKVVNIGKTGSGGSAISATCWASIA